MNLEIIDEASAFPEILFQQFNDKIKIVFDSDIKVEECMKNIPGSNLMAKQKIGKSIRFL
jgi:hypothetical protein